MYPKFLISIKNKLHSKEGKTMAYKIVALAKDPEISSALKKALSDGRLSFNEIKSIVYAAYNSEGVSLQEFKDL